MGPHTDISIVAAPQPARAQLLDRLGKLSEQLDWALDNPMQQPRPVGETELPKRLGGLLWELSGLEPEELRQRLELAREAERPLRLVVADDELVHLPWELLHHPHEELGFIAQHAFCGISRSVAGDGTRTPQCLAGPFRVLLFISSPEDLDPERSRLDFEQEEELLYSALDSGLAKGHVEIDVAEDGCLDTLLERMTDTHYHAVILSMHGVQSQDREGKTEWGLLFEEPESFRSAPMAGSRLARSLEELPKRPGLMVLSACRSARVEESGDSIQSVARALHKSGFERVLGMRLSVMDRAASAFNAKFFSTLVQGQSVGRAVSLARRELATGKWHDEAAKLDPYVQWSLPTLLERTADGPLLLRSSQPVVARPPRQPHGELIDGDGTLHLPSRSEFVGRRAQIRRYLRGFVQGGSPRLLLTGPGGVGKTTLAGFFARVVREREPQTRLLGFRAPFDLEQLEEPLRQAAFDGGEDLSLLQKTQAEPERRQRIYHLLHSLAARPQRPCLLMLDNLEAVQELESLKVRGADSDSLWLVAMACSLPAPTRVLLTGRYAVQELAGKVQPCLIPGASYGDVLRRMNRLQWPADWTLEDKRKLYERLGGNHRALQWMGQLLTGMQAGQVQELLSALSAVEVPPKTPAELEAVVLEAMRQNLLFEQLHSSLSEPERQLLGRGHL